MSPIIVGWQLNGSIGDARIQRLIEGISRRYQPLFQERLRCVGLWEGNQGLVHLGVPQPGDDGLHWSEDQICCRTGRPTTAGPTLPAGPAPVGAAALRDALVGPDGTVRPEVIGSLNPPFTCCWFDRREARIGLVHDGLGLDQFYVSLSPAGLVFSNRYWPILRLLDKGPAVDVEAWRYWFSAGWFPDTSTPLRNVRALAGGEIIVGDSRTVISTSADALGEWVRGGIGQDPGNLMTRAADAVRDVIYQNRPATGHLEADLTGGIDSRVICAVLSHERLPCRYYTGGSALSSDVVLARRLARRYGLDWVHTDDTGPLAADDPAGIMDGRFRQMTLWGEGLVEPGRWQGFPDAPAPAREGVYLGGGSGEISKGHYYRHVLQCDPGAAFDLDRSLAHLTRSAAGLLPDPGAGTFTDLVRHQLDQGAAAHGLRGWATLDYFYLQQRTRRWQGAHLAINLFQTDVLPLVNADHITLAFAMHPGAKADGAFHRFVIRRNAADFLRVPLSSEASRHPYFRILRLLERVRSVRRRDGGWANHLRGRGRVAIERRLVPGAPLWEILDRPKGIERWQDFVRGRSEDVSFPLALLAYSFWHAMVFEDA